MTEAILTFAATCQTKGTTLIPSWHKYINGSVDETGACSLQFVFPDDLGAILLAIVEILLRVGAIVAVAFVIYGGFIFITSQGEPDKAKNARHTIINAIIGLVIAIIATGVVSFIGGRLV